MFDTRALDNLQSSLKGPSCCIADIETDNINPEEVTKIHCISIKDRTTGINTLYGPQEILKGLLKLKSYDIVVGHNFDDYDMVCIRKLYPTLNIDPAKVVDTVIWSRMQYPQIFLKDKKNKVKLPKKCKEHSVEAWGIRLGIPKGDFGKTTDWLHYSPEMGEYCKQDVEVNEVILDYLESHVKSWDATILEQKISKIIRRQTEFGWRFAEKRAWKLYEELKKIEESLLSEIKDVFPLRVCPATKKVPEYIPSDTDYTDHDYAFYPKRPNKTRGYSKGQPFCKVNLVKFNYKADEHIRYWLKKLYNFKSWKKTDSGLDSVNNEVMSFLAEHGYEGTKIPEAVPLAKLLKLKKIIGYLDGPKGWLNMCRKGRIHGRINTAGAVTARMTHNSPNVGQVFTNDKFDSIGTDLDIYPRSLFIADEGMVNVGADAAGLEARCQAHYQFPYDRGNFANIILKGKKDDGTDLHSWTAKFLGNIKRSLAKTVRYAVTYGAQAPHVGHIMGGDARRGKQVMNMFLRGDRGYATVKEKVTEKIKKNGGLFAIDDRFLPIRSKHSSLNMLFQSMGAIVMKRALVIAYETLIDKYQWGKDFAIIGNIHDEMQGQARKEIAKTVGEIFADSIRLAGEYYNLRLPLKGEYDIGESWAETH